MVVPLVVLLHAPQLNGWWFPIYHQKIVHRKRCGFKRCLVRLNDTLLLPDGRQASGNAELVAAAVAQAQQMGRHP